jgi:hypothetical protein
MAVKKTPRRFQKYGGWWLSTMHPLAIEIECIRRGGQWKNDKGEEIGNGLFFHYQEAQKIAFPSKAWHKWNKLALEMFLQHQYIGELGCAAAGKSDAAASDMLMDWYCFPECTTVLISSTDLDSLEIRAWGMIKRYHREAKELFSWLPGHLIEGKRRIINSRREEFSEGRDFKNGLMAVPVKKGNAWVGLGSLVGIHNKRVRLLGDELNLMPRSFIDSVSNLAKCPDFKLRGLGNPNDINNAHGFICQPADELGGWESNIDQRPGTKTWKTRMPNGIAIQYPGSDSPNMDVPEGQPPPYDFLITRQQMADDAKIWMTDDWHYLMFNEGRFPRGQGSRRIITMEMCRKFHAFNRAVWRDSNQTSIAFLDAAYRGVGGDRCVFGELQFGLEAEGYATDPITNLISQELFQPPGRMLLNLVDTMIIPISAEKDSDQAEDQITLFCMDQCRRRGIPPSNFFFDAGMRTSLVTAFSRTWSADVESIDFGGKPSDLPVSSEIRIPCHDYFSKRVTELWYLVRLIIEGDQFRGMTMDVAHEGCSREFKMVSGNKTEVESKTDMKKKCGFSPDLFDALAAGVWGARRRGFVLSKLSHFIMKPEDRTWKRDAQSKADRFWKLGQLSA